VRESDSAAAKASIAEAVREGAQLYTMDIALAESLNALWKHYKIHRDIGENEYKWGAGKLRKVFIGFQSIASSEVCVRASDIAVRIDIPIYDALYVAAADQSGATLLTADQTLHKRCQGMVQSRLLRGGLI
jgi:predicted nucleic acid-binding protein